ncbi:MAG: cupin domain-containing protein [Pseudomonadales bacterium]|nr:cupin domain-containing protein [Pseudomonadales bacterium]
MTKLIIKNNEVEGITKTHFLNDNAIRLNKSLGDLAGLKNIGFHIIEVEPGHDSTEYHRHYFEDECCYILSGEATITIGIEEHLVSSGDFIGYPAGGDAHTMKNTGETTLVCIVVGQRLQNEVVDYPNLNKRLFCYGDKSDLVDINDISDV